MDDKEPIEMAGITARDLSRLNVGDRIALRIERSEDFRVIAVDDVLLTATQFNEVDIVFTRTEPSNYVRVAELRSKEASGAALEVLGVSSTPNSVALVQCRMPLAAAANAAVGLVRYLAANSPDAKDVLLAELKDLFANNGI